MVELQRKIPRVLVPFWLWFLNFYITCIRDRWCEFTSFQILLMSISNARSLRDYINIRIILNYIIFRNENFPNFSKNFQLSTSVKNWKNEKFANRVNSSRPARIIRDGLGLYVNFNCSIIYYSKLNFSQFWINNNHFKSFRRQISFINNYFTFENIWKMKFHYL